MISSKKILKKYLNKQWLRGKHITTDTLMDEAEFSYITLADQNQWDKQDHRDEKILVLTSIVQNMVSFASSSQVVSNETKRPQATKTEETLAICCIRTMSVQGAINWYS